MSDPIDICHARAESLSPSTMLYVWPHDPHAVGYSPKLIVTRQEGTVEISWSTRGKCFSARAPRLQARGLRDATLQAYADFAPAAEMDRSWPRTRNDHVTRSDHRAVSPAMWAVGREAIRSALACAHDAGVLVRLVEASERYADEARLVEIDAELAVLASERAALIARLVG